MSERCECHPGVKATTAYRMGCRAPESRAAVTAYNLTWRHNNPWQQLYMTQYMRRRRAAERGEEF